MVLVLVPCIKYAYIRLFREESLSLQNLKIQILRLLTLHRVCVSRARSEKKKSSGEESRELRACIPWAKDSKRFIHVCLSVFELTL